MDGLGEGVDATSPDFVARKVILESLSASQTVDLALHPVASVQSIFGLDIVEDPQQVGTADCPVAATYDPDAQPPQIRISLSGNSSRDAFSVLHELAHHLLYGDEYWNYEVLPGLGAQARRFEDSVANRFASLILVDDKSMVAALGGGVWDAAKVRQLFRSSPASRSAIISRVSSDDRSESMICFSTLDGVVQFGRSNCSIPVPSKGSRQAALALLAQRAASSTGQLSTVASASLEYSTGRSHSDMSISGAIDGDFLFAVAKPLYSLKSGGWSDDEEFECVVCHHAWPAGWSHQKCATCGEPRCPDCKSCACESRATYCINCTTSLSLADIARGDGLCEECSN